MIAAAFVLLFAGAYILQLSTQISYTLTDPDPVAEVFPPDNPLVVLYNNQDEAAVAALATARDDPNVKSAMSYSTTLGRPVHRRADGQRHRRARGRHPGQRRYARHDLLRRARRPGRGVTMTAAQFLRFLSQNVANNASFAPYIDESLTANLQTLMKFSDPAALTQRARRSRWPNFSA